MSDFKVIESQEQFDAVIGERIKREKETLSKKYEGYVSPDDYQKKTGEYERQISELNTALKTANEKIAGHDKALAERDSKIKEYESHSVKTRIAHEYGLSYEAAEFLNGDDEEAIRKSAESLKAIVGNSKAAPLASTEPAEINSEDAALKKTLKQLKGE